MLEQFEGRITELEQQMQIIKAAFLDHLEGHMGECGQLSAALDNYKEEWIESVRAGTEEIVNQILQELQKGR